MINIGGYSFEGPYILREKDFIDRAAVYAILCKDLSGNSYRLVYIGETEELETRLSGHNKKNCWENNCGSTLYVAIFYTPSDKYSREDRKKIEQELIDRYSPVCNDK